MGVFDQNLDGANNDQFINRLFKTIQKGPVTIFLGAGSSLECVDKNGKALLSFNQMQADIVNKYGDKDQKQIMSNGDSSQKWKSFLSVTKSLAAEKLLDAVLQEHLEGVPSYAHHILAAFAIAQENLHLTLTSNYDHIFSNAIGKIASTENKRFHVYPLKESMGSELLDMVNLSKDHPVIIKLFGDLGYLDGVFEPMELKHLVDTNWQSFQNALERPIIFIGYSFGDELYHSLLGRNGGAIYIVNPTPIKNLQTPRECRYFKGTFGEFMQAVLNKFNQENIPAAQEIQRLLQHIKPSAKYRKPEDILGIVDLISQRNIDMLKNRFRFHDNGKNQVDFLISRTDSNTWVDGFLSSSRPCMLLLGESGLGKSCFLYSLANNQQSNIIFSLFSGVALTSDRGLFGEISQEFCIPEHDIKELLLHIDMLLEQSASYKKWLIALDGINESSHFHIIMEQVIKFSSWGMKNIKLLYSCRTVFWEMENASKLYGQLECKHYSGWSCHIKNFSLAEAEEAYGKYQTALGISSNWSEINHQVQEYMCNPLMMRMIVLAYQGSALMEYIPATAVFEKYLEFLKEKITLTRTRKNTRALIILAEHKISNIKNKFINKDDLFFIDHFRQLNITEADIDLWQDEGVLVWIDKDRTGCFRFSFDRFYEHMLSEYMLGQLMINPPANLISWALDTYDQLDLACAHISYHEAVKSVIVYRGIKNDSIQVDELIATLKNQKYRHFTKQCLRELLFETNLPIIECFDRAISAATNAAEKDIYTEAQISLSTNSPKVIDIALPGIFNGDDLISHRCIRLLHSIGMNYRGKIIEKVAEIFASVASPKNCHYKGILYLYVLYFSWGQNSKERAQLLYEAISSYFPRLMPFPNYQECMAFALHDTIKQWGPYLFSTSSRNTISPFNYPWDAMGAEEKKFALIVNRAIAKRFSEINDEDMLAIRFFSMELPRVNLMSQTRPVGVATEFPFESKISQWALIRHGKSHFEDIIKILDALIKTNDFCTSDFSICLFYDMLSSQFKPEDPEFTLGYECLKSWVDYFWKNNDDFFGVLNNEDPYNDTYNPLEETGYVYAKIFPGNPTNIFIDEWTSSEDMRRKKLGLLAVRRMWQENGMQVLRSAKILFQETEAQIYTWLNKLMKEISLVDRRIYDMYINELQLSMTRCQEIEHTHSCVTHADNYSATTLLEFFCNNGPDRIDAIQYWHREMCQSSSLDNFLNKLAQHLIAVQQKIISNKRNPLTIW